MGGGRRGAGRGGRVSVRTDEGEARRGSQRARTDQVHRAQKDRNGTKNVKRNPTPNERAYSPPLAATPSDVWNYGQFRSANVSVNVNAPCNWATAVSRVVVATAACQWRAVFAGLATFALDASPKDLTRALPGYPTFAMLIQASHHHPKHSPRRRPFHKIQRAQERITLDPVFFPSSWPLPLCPALRSHLRLQLRLLLRLFLCGSAVSMYHHFKRKYDDAASDSPSRKTGPAAKESRRVVVVAKMFSQALARHSDIARGLQNASPPQVCLQSRLPSDHSCRLLHLRQSSQSHPSPLWPYQPDMFAAAAPLFTVYGTWHDKSRFIQASFGPSLIRIYQGFFDVLYKLSDVAVAVLSWYCLLGAAYVG
ncbi:hypothetical protein C8R44DRAFT_864424 [Mycena epipterygia]|nr:hypothetical protein C8R44DRAFT_864424 [Mycena epipterygia]